MTNYDLGSLSVLVIDDSPYMLKLLAMVLRAMNVGKVKSLDQPQRALELIKRDEPHLVITDILMSPLDGVSLTKAIRETWPEPIAFTPVFVLSGFTDRDHVIRARDAGAHEVLTKPISARALYERICALIEHPRDFVRNDGYFGPDRRAGRRAHDGPERRRDPEPAGGDYFDIDI